MKGLCTVVWLGKSAIHKHIHTHTHIHMQAHTHTHTHLEMITPTNQLGTRMIQKLTDIMIPCPLMTSTINDTQTAYGQA